MTPKAELSASLTAILLPHLRATGRYHLPGFGIWTLKVTKGRRIRNPVTWLPASLTVRFHPAKRLRKAVRASVRAVAAKAAPNSTGTAVQRHNAHSEAP